MTRKTPTPPKAAIEAAFQKAASKGVLLKLRTAWKAVFSAGGTPDQPAIVAVQADGVTWFVVRDYSHRQEGLKDGTGCFIVFQSKNLDPVTGEETWGDWVMLNGGLIDRTKGKEQGDLDLLTVIDGKVGGFAIVGNMVEAGGAGPGLVPINDRQMSMGSAALRLRDIFVGGLLDVVTVGVQINLGTDGQPNWQWRDCIPVRTQQGVRFVQTYAASAGSFPAGVV